MYKIRVADWRLDEAGPMLVVSGTLGKEKVHFQAPDAAVVPYEMDRFIEWFNSRIELDGILKKQLLHICGSSQYTLLQMVMVELRGL